jgi:hypothetical protein
LRLLLHVPAETVIYLRPNLERICLMNFASFLAALQEVETLLVSYAPIATAALNALKSAGLPGLIAYLETLLVTPPPGPLPPVASIKASIATLKTHV